MCSLVVFPPKRSYPTCCRSRQGNDLCSFDKHLADQAVTIFLILCISKAIPATFSPVRGPGSNRIFTIMLRLGGDLASGGTCPTYPRMSWKASRCRTASDPHFVEFCKSSFPTCIPCRQAAADMVHLSATRSLLGFSQRSLPFQSGAKRLRLPHLMMQQAYQASDGRWQAGQHTPGIAPFAATT